MKKYLSWAAINLTLLAALVLGNLYEMPSIAMFATFFFWVTALLAAFGYIFVKIDIDISYMDIQEMVETSRIYRSLDIFYDVIVVGTLMYFTYPLLAFVYALHIFFLHSTLNIIKEKAQHASTEK